MNATERFCLLARPLIILVIILAFLVPPPLSAPACAAADAAQSDMTLRVALLGDSYSAGSGAGDYEIEEPDDPRGRAYRSRNSWVHHYVDWLSEQGVHATLASLARSGATTEDVVNEQVGGMPADTDLVMLTVGGADVRVADIVRRCFVPGSRSASGCRETVEAADGRLESATVEEGVAVPSVRSQTRSVLEALDARLADGAQVVLVGYPHLSRDRAYRLSDAGGETYDAGTGVRRLSESMRETQSALVDEWNMAHSSTLKVTYIDSTATAFSGHEPDPSAGGHNDHRWINEAQETEGRLGGDGTTVSRFSGDTNTFYQLNKIGHEQIAELIEKKVGVPGNVKPAAPSSAGIDVVFAVRATAAMADDAAAIRANMRSIIDRAADSASSYRFALVSYGGATGDERARTHVDLTADAAAVEKGLDALAGGSAGGVGETGRAGAPVYSGVMQAVGLNWRSEARKEVIVVGDAPADDPEPVTGYTTASVARAAYEADSVSIYAIGAGTEGAGGTGGTAGPSGSPDASGASSALEPLASASGGSVEDSSSPDDLAGLIDGAMAAETSKPFAWIQGDYVIQAGDSLTIDASASYAASGQIVSYEWDFDGDGAYDQTTTAPTVEHAFPDEFEGVVGVRATQSDGLSAMATSPIMVTDDGDQTPRESDNCPDINNWGQTDEDADGVGDECDSSPGFPEEDEAGVSEVADGASAPTDDSADPADPSDPAAGSPSAVPAADRTVPDASSAPVVAAPDDASGALGDSADPGIAVVSPVVVSVPSSSSAAGGSAMLARTGISAPDAALAAALIVVGGISMAMCIHRRSRR